MDKPVWNPTVTRVREWYLAQDAHGRYWKCNVAYVCLDDVVLARVMDEQPAGHFAMELTLRTLPAKVIVVDGNPDNWWHLHDLRMQAMVAAAGKGGDNGRTD